MFINLSNNNIFMKRKNQNEKWKRYQVMNYPQKQKYKQKYVIVGIIVVIFLILIFNNGGGC